MKRILFFIIILLLINNIYGFQWPVSEVVLISTFGESEFNEYIKGLDIGGDIQDIRPIDSGELVYYSRYNSSPLDLPSGLGSYVIYQHKNGIRSLYGHLEDSSIKADNYQVGMSDVIGTMGTTGTAVGPMLHIQVMDIEFKKYINPLLSLPFLNDKTKPVINEVILRP